MHIRPAPAISAGYESRRCKVMPALRDIPKSMIFDGKSNWQPFEMKFTHYARSYQWTLEDCKVCLLHCLAGKALDYCTRLFRTNPQLPYTTLLSKLRERFGPELQASAQAKFNQSAQQKKENMEDWADRVQELASEAFVNLPMVYSNQQSIDRFCEGLLDLVAGHSVFMKKHSTTEAAMNDVHLYQHSKSDMVKRNQSRRQPFTPSVVDYDEETRNQVCAIHPTKPPDLNSLQEQLDEKLLKNMTMGRPRRQRQTGCFRCGDKSHFIRDCPKTPDHDNLNGNRSSQRANSRP